MIEKEKELEVSGVSEASAVCTSTCTHTPTHAHTHAHTHTHAQHAGTCRTTQYEGVLHESNRQQPGMHYTYADSEDKTCIQSISMYPSAFNVAITMDTYC